MEESLSIPVNVRMTPAEAEILDEICSRWRCTRSEVIRTLVRGPGTADMQGRRSRGRIQETAVLQR